MKQQFGLMLALFLIASFQPAYAVSGNHHFANLLSTQFASRDYVSTAQQYGFTLSASPASKWLTYPKTNYTSFSLHVVPIAVSCAEQSSSNFASYTFTVVVESINGSSTPVSLSASGLPAGASASFNPVTVTPPSNGGANATLTISTSGRLSGTYPISIVGTSPGTFVVIGATLSCFVDNFVDEFSIVVSPPVVNVSQGSSATATVSMPGLPGMPVGQNITLTGSGNPQGMNVKFSPNTLTLQPGATGLSTLTISVDTSVPVGNYTLTISATASTVYHSTNILVRVVSPKCIIATAAYGSELAGPVQFLRDFRDHDVASTRLGHAFLTVFNAWYYSWAPPVAQTIANSNGNMKSSIRVLIAPLIASLFVAHGVFQNTVALNPEVAILLAGFVASALIGVMYLTLPITILMYRNRRGTRGTKYLFLVVAIVGLILTLFGTIMHGSADLMELSTSLLVVQTILLTPTALARTILNHYAHQVSLKE